MSEQDETANNTEEVQQDELGVLKERADKMGIKYHPNIKVDTLRARVDQALNPTDTTDKQNTDEETTTTTTTRVTVDKAETSPGRQPNESLNDFRLRKRREASELIRIRLTCMDPAKREHEGEIFSAGNSQIGTFTKFVPYNADEGWHVPRIIYNQLVQKKCQVFQTKRDRKGNSFKEGKLIKAFSIEVLPPLTKEELDDLAQRQAMSGSVG